MNSTEQQINPNYNEATADQNLLQQIGALGANALSVVYSGIESTKRHVPKYAVAGTLGLSAIGGAQEAINPTEAAAFHTKTISPAGIRNNISMALSYKYGLVGSGIPSSNTIKATLSAQHLTLRGKCELIVKNRNFDVKDMALSINDKKDEQVRTLCGKRNGKHIVQRVRREDWPHEDQRTPLDYSTKLKRLGYKAGVSSGYTNHGDAKYIWATRRKAVVKYKKNESISGQQLKQLVLRKDKKAIPSYY